MHNIHVHIISINALHADVYTALISSVRAAPTFLLSLSLCSFTLGWFALRELYIHNSKSWWGNPYTPSVYFIAVLSTRISLSLSSRGDKWKNNFSALFRMTTTNPRATFLITHSVSFANWILCAIAHVKSALMHQSNVSQVIRIWWAARLLCVHIHIKFGARVDSRPPRELARPPTSL